jgi:succinoglycan biosynthesis protein ExoA
MDNNPEIAISIIVACRNEMRHMGPFLDSLLMQDMDGLAWEAIIADGMSSDGTRQFLEEYCAQHPRVRVIANTGKIVSTGLNMAIQAARGDIVLRMDAHTIYASDYCRRCVETLLSTGAGNVGGPARTKVEGVVPRAIAAAYHSRFSTGGAKFHDENYEGWVDTVPYGCWKKETLERIGLFDEALVRNQDDELNLRLLRAGDRIWQNPTILSWYSPRATVSGLFHQYFQYGFWKVMVIRKHRLPGSWRHLVPAGFAAAIIGLPAADAVAWGAGAPASFKIALTLWLGLVLSYGLASIIASALAARRYGWATLPWLPWVFAAFHFSYGSGFLIGMLRLMTAPASEFSNESVFARITR